MEKLSQAKMGKSGKKGPEILTSDVSNLQKKKSGPKKQVEIPETPDELENITVVRFSSLQRHPYTYCSKKGTKKEEI